MKRILLAFLAIVLVITNISAQIILNSSDYPASVIGTDSLKITSSTSSFPSLTAMTDGMWDMSMVTDTTPVYFSYRVPTVTYQYADSNQYSFSGYSYQGNMQSSIASTGIFEYGVNVQGIGYSLLTLTTGSTDSFIINPQNITYSSPRQKIAFSATYHSVWSSEYYSDFGFKLTFIAAGYNDAPGILRTYATEKDSVVGWGKMRVKDAAGNPSLYFDVLQVKTIITKTDSFFINGLLAPGSLLTLLNASQGQKNTAYEQYYYRVGEITPLANVQFRDSTYTTPYKATTHAQRLVSNAVKGFANRQNVKIYPNPISDGIVSIDLPFTHGLWEYELTDINGKKVMTGLLQANTSTTVLYLQPAVSPGVYYLKLSNDGMQVCTHSLEIVR
jgi:type IX secretion system substrate protein